MVYICRCFRCGRDKYFPWTYILPCVSDDFRSEPVNCRERSALASERLVRFHVTSIAGHFTGKDGLYWNCNSILVSHKEDLCTIMLVNEKGDFCYIFSVLLRAKRHPHFFQCFVLILINLNRFFGGACLSHLSTLSSVLLWVAFINICAWATPILLTLLSFSVQIKFEKAEKKYLQ